MKIVIEDHEIHYSEQPQEIVVSDYITTRNEGIRSVTHELADGTSFTEWIVSNVIKEIDLSILNEHDELIAELIEGGATE